VQKYTEEQFEAEFPDSDACLDALFYRRFGGLICCPRCGVVAAQFMRVDGRKCYACVHCRYQLYPMAGTIFEKSTTPLKLWFRALYAFSVSRNGVSALELERKLGVSRKCAWRIGIKIREAMRQDPAMLSGVTEADEAYYGGRRRSSNRFSNKVPLLGAVERGGHVRVVVTDQANATNTMRFVKSTIAKGSVLNTDESRLYYRAPQDYKHHTVAHGNYEFVRDKDYTNTIEHFWGMLKPSLLGTHRSVSKQHLQAYVNEAVWKYNHRGEQLFPLLLDAVAQPV